jgi:hypothetical protein
MTRTILLRDIISFALKNTNHPLNKIFACLPVGREEFLSGLGPSPRFSEALPLL